MAKVTLHTDYAPAERADADILQQDIVLFAEDTLQHALLDAAPDIFLILNEQRQIIFANETTLKTLGVPSAEALFGLRPGEAVDCVHATENAGGCGTTEFCKNCGAVNAILSSLRGKETVNECRIIQKNGDALDLRVWATPLTVQGKIYSIFAIKDIANEKRRRVLERIFFHDILNTAGGLQGLAEILQDSAGDEADELKRLVFGLAEELVDEIKAQRLLLAAENGDLAIEKTKVSVRPLLHDVLNIYKEHEVTQGRYIQIDPRTPNIRLETDETLLKRVIGNMLKNALEACQPEETATMGATLSGAEIEIWVHNPAFIPRKTQLQIFQRSFSTKGAGRGLGTYSIKLLTERYLDGRVSFTTSPEAGTTFRVFFPVDKNDKRSPLAARLMKQAGSSEVE